jgi:hypothetical protein
MIPKLRKLVVALALFGLLLVMMLPTVSASTQVAPSGGLDGSDQQDCTPRQILYELVVYAYGAPDGEAIHTVANGGAPLCVTDLQASAAAGHAADGYTMQVTGGVLPAPPKF